MFSEFEFDQTAGGREKRIRDLPTFYYHGHFVEMLDFVAAHYAHVLADEHVRVIEEFMTLSHAAQCLYVRLNNRKGRVFATRRLRYPELGPVGPLLAELHEHGWVGAPGPEQFDDVLRFLTRDVLRDMLARRFTGLARAMKKADLVAFARANLEPAQLVADLEPAQSFVQKRVDAVRYLSFLYFGRVQDGLDRFTLRDLGLVRVHDFREAFEPRFGERDEAREHYYFARRRRDAQRADEEGIRRLAAESADWPEPVWPGAALERDKLAYRIGRRLEASGDPGTAREVYARGESTRCSERLVRLLLKDGRREAAAGFLERCLDSPRSDEEWLFARDLYERKFNRKRTSALTDRLRAAEIIELDESLMGNPERAAAAYFERAGAVAYRTENALWRTLFGLLFWPELFGADSATLHSPFEHMPKTLGDGSFARDNAALIDERLALLADMNALKGHLLKIATRHYGTANGVFRWRRRTLDALFAFIEAAPAPAMQAVLRGFCDNYREARYGYPDLLLIDADGVRFVEIKTDGDQLRRNQLLRIEQLAAAGFRAGIARIRWMLDPLQVYVVVDVETTGGRGEHHRVTEVGAVKVRNGRIVDRYSTLVNPQRTIPPGITRLTGISAAMVADAPYFVDIADRFADFMGDAIFVAHNVEFDYRFIRQEFKRIGRPFRHAKLCTCASMRKLYPGHRSYSLNSLCSRYGIPLERHHRALCDAEAAAELLLMINEKRAERLAAETG